MAVTGKALINGVSYSHSNIVVNILGVPRLGVTAISYGDPQNIELNHATGNRPISRGYGEVIPEGSITMEMVDVERLSGLSPDGKIQNLPPFDIGVNFITQDGKTARHRLQACVFKGRAVDSSTGNMQLVEALELSIGDIIYNG